MADVSETPHTPETLDSPSAILNYLARNSQLPDVNETVETPSDEWITMLFSGGYMPFNDDRRIENRIREAAKSGNYTEILKGLRNEIDSWRNAYSKYGNVPSHFANESTDERIDIRLKELRFSMLLVAANMAAGQLTSLEDISRYFISPAQHLDSEGSNLLPKRYTILNYEFAIKAVPAAYSLNFEADSQSNFPPLYNFFKVNTFEDLVNSIKVIQLIKLVKDKVSQTSDVNELAQELNTMLSSCPAEYRTLIHGRMQIFDQYGLLEGSDPIAYLTRALIEHAAMPIKRPLTARAALAKWVDSSTPPDRTLSELKELSSDEANVLKSFIQALILLRDGVKKGEYYPYSPMNAEGLESMNLEALNEFIFKLTVGRGAGQAGHGNRF